MSEPDGKAVKGSVKRLVGAVAFVVIMGDCTGSTSVERDDKELRRLPLPLSTPLASTYLPPGGGAPMRVGLPLAAVLVRLRTCGLPVSCLSAR